MKSSQTAILSAGKHSYYLGNHSSPKTCIAMPAVPSATELPRVPFRTALAFWTKLGFISFGGPAGQIAVMHAELVERRRWISERRFLHALNYCMLLPGPEAQQLATYIGWLLHGTWGGIVAGALFVLPSLFILMGLSWLYAAYRDIASIEAVFSGLKPAMVAVVTAAVIRLWGRAVTTPAAAALAVGALLATLLRVPFPVIVVAAGVLGYLLAHVRPGALRAPVHAPSSNADDHSSEIVIDDHHEAPPHTHPSGLRFAVHLAVGLCLWAAPLAALVLWQGAEHTLPRMGRFFTQAALVTFGGAYAVLPYVRDYSIRAGWLSAEQILDGLALGETTPGPLIMFVAFVGFVGGWQTAGMGWPGGVLGCLTATYFTFLPSILFVLLGAPLFERTRSMMRLSAALSGITAAVVGVVLHLAVTLALQVFLVPHSHDWLAKSMAALFGRGEWPMAEAIDLWAVLLAGAALAALWRWKVGIVQVVLACGVLGLARLLV